MAGNWRRLWEAKRALPQLPLTAHSSLFRRRKPDAANVKLAASPATISSPRIPRLHSKHFPHNGRTHKSTETVSMPLFGLGSLIRGSGFVVCGIGTWVSFLIVCVWVCVRVSLCGEEPVAGKRHILGLDRIRSPLTPSSIRQVYS